MNSSPSKLFIKSTHTLNQSYKQHHQQEKTHATSFIVTYGLHLPIANLLILYFNQQDNGKVMKFKSEDKYVEKVVEIKFRIAIPHFLSSFFPS